jgi:hypothetical protein
MSCAPANRVCISLPRLRGLLGARLGAYLNGSFGAGRAVPGAKVQWPRRVEPGSLIMVAPMAGMSCGRDSRFNHTLPPLKRSGAQPKLLKSSLVFRADYTCEIMTHARPARRRFAPSIASGA